MCADCIVLVVLDVVLVQHGVGAVVIAVLSAWSSRERSSNNGGDRWKRVQRADRSWRRHSMLLLLQLLMLMMLVLLLLVLMLLQPHWRWQGPFL